jgi:hypothetical protein
MDINSAFQSTFKVIFGECNVSLEQLEPYLLRYQPKPQMQKSSKSGRPVMVSGADYPQDAKFLSQEEIDFAAKAVPLPLGINEIKDIDSVFEAIGERAFYTGNKIFGNSAFVENCDNITDSQYVKDSFNIHTSKYVACSSYIHDNSEFIFGSSWLGRGKFLIRAINALDLNRSFECYSSGIGSDMFCTFNCLNCYDVMFSFNLKAKRNAIGNLELPKEKYLELKKKLIAEAREYIEKRKDFPSILEIATGKQLPANMPKEIAIKPLPKYDSAPIEKSWASTSKLIFGSEIGALQQASGYLKEPLRKTSTVKTPYGSEAYFADIFFFPAIPKERMVSNEEATELAKMSLKNEEMGTLGAVLSNLEKIAFYRINFRGGSEMNNANTAIAYDSINAFEVLDSTGSKNNAYCTMALSSSYCFGSFRAVHCEFCVRCHNCSGLSRCLEMDSCSNCRDSMFCHNSENLTDCMFCFNTKNKHYAIGNVEIGRESYMRIKKILLDGLVAKIKAGEKTAGIYSMRA